MGGNSFSQSLRSQSQGPEGAPFLIYPLLRLSLVSRSDATFRCVSSCRDSWATETLRRSRPARHGGRRGEDHRQPFCLRPRLSVVARPGRPGRRSGNRRTDLVSRAGRGYSPAYLTENADGLRQDWPRIPLPKAKDSLVASAALGRQVAALLDTETPVSGVTAGKIRDELKASPSFSAWMANRRTRRRRFGPDRRMGPCRQGRRDHAG